MSKQKFNSGDTVRISQNPVYKNRYNQLKGTGKVIAVVQPCSSHGPQRVKYRVQFDGKKMSTTFYSYELESVKQENTKKDKPIQMVYFRPQDYVTSSMSSLNKLCENKKPITFHTDLKPGHVVCHDSGAISWQEDDLFGITEKDKKFEVGDYVILTDETTNWILKNGSPSQKAYFTMDNSRVFKITKLLQATPRCKPIYELDNIFTIRFFEKDLMPAPNPDQQVTLKNIWKHICNEYLKKFCQKHSYDYEPDMWVGSDPGTSIEVNDMFVSMDTIRYDIDNNIPEEKFDKWYWKNLDIYELTGETYMNYPSFCKGAPDYWTEERIKGIRASKKKIEEAKKELEKTIEDTKKGKLF